jgi:hypothetical protein
VVNGRNAVAPRTTLKYVVDPDIDVILGKTKSLKQDVGFVIAWVASPGLHGIIGRSRKRQ